MERCQHLEAVVVTSSGVLLMGYSCLLADQLCGFGLIAQPH